MVSCLKLLLVLLTLAAPACTQVAVSTERAGTERTTAPPDARATRLKLAVEDAYGATLDSQDLDKLANSVHPKVIKMAGGREQFKKLMAGLLESKKTQFESVRWRVDEPTQIIDHDGKVFGVVPRGLDGITVAKERVMYTASIVGISSDNGQTWKFVNGASFASMFPEYAGLLNVPEERKYVDGVEQ